MEHAVSMLEALTISHRETYSPEFVNSYFYFLPLVGGFRYPCRYRAFADLAGCLLASLGLTVLLRQFRRGRQADWRPVMPVNCVVLLSVVAALAGLLVRYLTPISWMIASPYKILAGPLLFGIAALIILAGRRSSTDDSSPSSA